MHLSLLVFSDDMLNNDVMKSIIFLPVFCQVTNVLSPEKSQEKLLSKVVPSCVVCCSLPALIGFSFNCN